MKKLMIALAVVASAIAVRAASVDWSFYEQALDKNNPTDISSYTAYLFTESAWTTALADGISASTWSSAASSSALTKTTGGSGANTWTKWAVATKSATGDSGNYYIVIADAQKYTASGAIAGTSYATPQDAHTEIKWNIAANKTPLSDASFTTYSVPEPTSGLLLILGMAGLALKRKHA